MTTDEKNKLYQSWVAQGIISQEDFGLLMADPFKPDWCPHIEINPALMDNKNLKLCFELCCEEYRRRINAQWDFDIKDSWWVADRVGDVLILCDLEYSLGMGDVRLFVDLGISYPDFREWWNYNLDAFNYANHPINSYSWFVNGCRPKDLNNGETDTVE